MAQRFRRRTSSGNRATGRNIADLRICIVPKCPSSRRAELKSLAKVSPARSVTERTQKKAGRARGPAAGRRRLPFPRRSARRRAGFPFRPRSGRRDRSRRGRPTRSGHERLRRSRDGMPWMEVATKISPIRSAGSSAPQKPVLTIAARFRRRGIDGFRRLAWLRRRWRSLRSDYR